MRNYATYVDFDFISYASMSLASFLATNDFDRLSVLIPGDDNSKESRILEDFVAVFRRNDKRIVAVDLDSLPEFSERGNQNLRKGHPQLFADIARSAVFAAFGGPVAWFDSDTLFLGDISELLTRVEHTPLEAAPDMTSLRPGCAGSNVYHAFRDHMARAQPAATLSDVPINCGVLVLRADLRAQFRAGLDHSLQFLEASIATATLTHAELSIVRHTVGQLAWNFVFSTVGARCLPSSYNWFAGAQPIGDSFDRADAPRVIHYIGPVKKWRMALDYTLLFGRHGAHAWRNVRRTLVPERLDLA